MFSAVNRQIERPDGVFVIDAPEPPHEKITAELAQSEAQKVSALTVTNQSEYELAAGEMVRLKSLIKRAHEIFDPICDDAFKTHKTACAKRAEVIDPLEKACKVLDPKLGGYLAEQKRLAEERERQALIAAQAEAEAAREAEIEQAEVMGASAEEVRALCERPLEPIPVVVPRRAAPAGPVTARETYQAVVTNKALFLKHVASRPDHFNLVEVNDSALNQLARALKGALSIPGVQVQKVTSTSTRTKGAR